MRKRTTFVVLFLLVAAVAAARQPPVDDESVWHDFLTWFKSAPAAGNPLAGYAETLTAAGKSGAEVQRRMGLLARLLDQRADWIEAYFDKAFARPISGDPARDGFNSAPSDFVAAVVTGLHPGTALDAGMGQGRHAVFLARHGWTTTGFDVSARAVAAARENAARERVSLEAVKADYDHFDFGQAKWDLIVLTFAWAPVDDPAFVARIRASLRPGGRVIFEHFVEDAGHPRPRAVRALQPGQLRSLFKTFLLERYEEVDGVGDWGGPGERLVRMVAVKQDNRKGDASSAPGGR